jgi:hypothetical protein
MLKHLKENAFPHNYTAFNVTEVATSYSDIWGNPEL